MAGKRGLAYLWPAADQANRGPSMGRRCSRGPVTNTRRPNASQFSEGNPALTDFGVQPTSYPKRAGLRDAHLEAAVVEPIPDPFNFNAAVYLLPLDRCAQYLQQKKVEEKRVLPTVPSRRVLAIIGVQE